MLSVDRHPLQEADGGAQERVAADDGRGAGDVEDRALVAVAPLSPFSESALDQPVEVVDLDRLLEEVEGAELHRLDRRRDGAEAGEDHHRHARLGGAARRQHLEAREVGELQVGEHEVEVLAPEEADAGLAVGGRSDGVALLRERVLQHAAQRVAVLDDQDARGGHGAQADRARRTAAASASSSPAPTVRRSRSSRPWRR